MKPQRLHTHRLRKGLAKAILKPIGYAPVKAPNTRPKILSENPQGDYYEFLLQSLLQQSFNPDFSLVQIGASDGLRGDPLHDFIQSHNPTGILLEPQPEAFATLRQTYRSCDRLTLVNAALGTTCGKRTLYQAHPSYDYPSRKDGLPTATRHASFHRDHVVAHLTEGRGIPASQIDDHMVMARQVDCVTFDHLFETYKPSQVDLLSIDAEGFDYEVLKLFDFSIRRPGVVYYEHRNLSEADRQASWRMLVEMGYKIAPLRFDTLAVFSG